nr:MAG TPA: hypothetical protein [Herelleviridae sp.]
MSTFSRFSFLRCFSIFFKNITVASSIFSLSTSPRI